MLALRSIAGASEEEKQKIVKIVLSFVGPQAPLRGPWDMCMYHNSRMQCAINIAATSLLPIRAAIKSAEDAEQQDEAPQDDDEGFVMLAEEDYNMTDESFVWLEEKDYTETSDPAPGDMVLGSPAGVTEFERSWQDMKHEGMNDGIVVQLTLKIGEENAPAGQDKLVGAAAEADKGSEEAEEQEKESASAPTESSSASTSSSVSKSAPTNEKGDLLQHYASMSSIEAVAHAIVDGVKESGQGRKFLLHTIIRGLHPDKQKGHVGNKIIAERVAKIANTIKTHFTEKELWGRPDEWKGHIKFLSRDQL